MKQLQQLKRCQHRASQSDVIFRPFRFVHYVHCLSELSPGYSFARMAPPPNQNEIKTYKMLWHLSRKLK